MLDLGPSEVGFDVDFGGRVMVGLFVVLLTELVLCESEVGFLVDGSLEVIVFVGGVDCTVDVLFAVLTWEE